jgi:hypothetical protein
MSTNKKYRPTITELQLFDMLFPAKYLRNKCENSLCGLSEDYAMHFKLECGAWGSAVVKALSY